MSKEFFGIQGPKTLEHREYLRRRPSLAGVGFEKSSFPFALPRFTFILQASFFFFFFLLTPRLCWVEGDEFLPVII